MWKGCESNVFALLGFSCFVTVPYEVLLQPMSLTTALKGSKGATSAPCEWPFFASLAVGFRLCFAVSHPLPRGCRFAFVQARLRHVFCLRTGALFFSFRGSKGATSHPCEWPFFASPELGFRWCLAVSDPLPSGCRCAFVATYWGSFLFL